MCENISCVQASVGLDKLKTYVSGLKDILDVPLTVLNSDEKNLTDDPESSSPQKNIL